MRCEGQNLLFTSEWKKVSSGHCWSAGTSRSNCFLRCGQTSSPKILIYYLLFLGIFPFKYLMPHGKPPPIGWRFSPNSCLSLGRCEETNIGCPRFGHLVARRETKSNSKVGNAEESMRWPPATSPWRSGSSWPRRTLTPNNEKHHLPYAQDQSHLCSIVAIGLFGSFAVAVMLQHCLIYPFVGFGEESWWRNDPQGRKPFRMCEVV